MSVPIAAMKSVQGLRLQVETIHGKFTTTDALLGVIQLMSDMNSFLVS